MKKIIAVLVALAALALAPSSRSQWAGVLGGSRPSALVPRDSQTGTAINFEHFVVSAPSQNIAFAFTAAGTYTITQADIPIYLFGGSSGLTYSLSVAIYSDNGSNAPNAQIGTASSLVAATALPSSQGSPGVVFTGMSASLTASTKYWIVISSNQVGPQNGTQYVIWPAATGIATDICLTSPTPIALWSQADSFANGLFSLYGP